MVDMRAAQIVICMVMCLGLAHPTYAQGTLPPTPSIKHRIPLRIVEALTCDIESAPCSPSVPYDMVRADLDRANEYWRSTGIEFWIRSFEHIEMPLLSGRDKVTLYTWPQVRDELQRVFPQIPDDAYSDSDGHQKAVQYWLEASAAFYGDPNEIFVLIARAGGSAGSFPWRGRVVFLDRGDIPATTFGHELGHFLGLVHTDVGLPTHPNPTDSYTNCDRWDMVYKPTNPPIFFASPGVSSCNAGVSAMAPAIDLHGDAPDAMVTVEIGGVTFSPGDWEIMGLVASTGHPHAPPTWGYALNIMGNFDNTVDSDENQDGKPDSVDGATPRFISASQALVIQDFLTWDVPLFQENVDLITRPDGTIPPGAHAQALTSLRTKLGKTLSWRSWHEFGGTTDVSPTAVAFGNRLYLFSKGIADTKIYVSSSANGRDWSTWRELGGTTDVSLAAAAFGNRLYLFAKGVADKKIYLSSSADGQNWSTWKEFGGTTDVSLAAAAFGNTLYLFSKGVADGKIYVSSSE